MKTKTNENSRLGLTYKSAIIHWINETNNPNEFEDYLNYLGSLKEILKDHENVGYEIISLSLKLIENCKRFDSSSWREEEFNQLINDISDLIAENIKNQ